MVNVSYCPFQVNTHISNSPEWNRKVLIYQIHGLIAHKEPRAILVYSVKKKKKSTSGTEAAIEATAW